MSESMLLSSVLYTARSCKSILHERFSYQLKWTGLSKGSISLESLETDHAK